jgi:hypothetical protein
MRHKHILANVILLALIMPARAAVAPTARPMSVLIVTGDLEQWQRVDIRFPLRNAAQIKIAIQTKGPPLQGLIRIPGGWASNFDTGKGVTIIELINVGDETNGYADIVALEVLFTQSMANQRFWIDFVDTVK